MLTNVAKFLLPLGLFAFANSYSEEMRGVEGVRPAAAVQLADGPVKGGGESPQQAQLADEPVKGGSESPQQLV